MICTEVVVSGEVLNTELMYTVRGTQSRCGANQLIPEQGGPSKLGFLRPLYLHGAALK